MFGFAISADVSLAFHGEQVNHESHFRKEHEIFWSNPHFKEKLFGNLDIVQNITKHLILIIDNKLGHNSGIMSSSEMNIYLMIRQWAYNLENDLSYGHT